MADHRDQSRAIQMILHSAAEPGARRYASAVRSAVSTGRGTLCAARADLRAMEYPSRESLSGPKNSANACSTRWRRWRS